jgi:glutamate transport system substrate-binding protein
VAVVTKSNDADTNARERKATGCEPYGIGLRKGDTALRTWLNDLLERIVAGGRYQQAWRSTAGAYDPAVATPPPVVRY